MDPIKTGQLIAELRKQKGMNQTELANLLNISNRTVSKWENGDGFPDISILPDLATIFGITTDELFAGELNTNEDIATPVYPTFTFTGKSEIKDYIIIYKKYYRDRIPLWLQIIYTVCISLIIIFLANGVTELFDISSNFIVYFVVLLFFLLFSFFAPYINGYLAYRNNKALLGDKNVDSKLVISDKIYMDNGTSNHREYDFSDVTGFYDYKGYYMFKLYKRVFIASKKSSLQDATTEDFERYVNSRITPKKASHARLIIATIVCVLLIIDTVVFGIASVYMANNDSNIEYSTEEIVELDDNNLCYVVIGKIYDKIDYDSNTETYILSSLNQSELNFYYVYSFYEEYLDGGVNQYAFNYNDEMPYLSSALSFFGLDDIVKEYGKYLSKNNIDVYSFSKEKFVYEDDYDSMMAKLDDSGFNSYLEQSNSDQKIMKALADYYRAHTVDFE